jgi:hypothetical protein
MEGLLMDRQEMTSWLETHPDAVRGDVDELLERCERAVRKHAVEEAWLHARAIALERMKYWEHSFGNPSSEDFVAREACHELAGELRQHEPTVEEGSEDRFADHRAWEAFEPEARDQLRRWIRDLAHEEEHRVWLDVVRFTHRRGSAMVHEGKVSRDFAWDPEHSYARAAWKVMRILADDYEERAHPHAR